MLHFLGHLLAEALSYPFDTRILSLVSRARNRVYWNALKRRFRSVGPGSFIEYPAVLRGASHISIGKNFVSYSRLRLEAYDCHLGHRFAPEIVIGNNVSLNYDCHIAAINRIVISDNVLIASGVYISDHFHGNIDQESLRLPPAKRKLESRGPVIIEENVWLGERVTVMPGVTIGRNSIIGANAVVTRNVPANSVAAGTPARVIRQIAQEASR